MPTRVPVVVVGGGQAGLAISWHLTSDGIDHVVLERDTMVHNWLDSRWDTFCLVTPNWQCRLPGYAYAGPDPDGFMVRSQIIDWLAGYVATFDPPVREHCAVSAVTPRVQGGFDVMSADGPLIADQVVVATGGYHRPVIPALAHQLPPEVVSLHSSQYRNPEALPAGAVLVVGTGQSGAQIAEDLFLAGRDVHLAVGGAPRFARRYRGRDVIAWMHDTGHYAKPVTDKPASERTRDKTNHYVTGRNGGHDIDLRLFAQHGLHLHGKLISIDDGVANFADDLGANLDGADRVYNDINAIIDTYIAVNDIDTVDGPSRYEPVWTPPAGGSQLAADEIAAVVWATGFARQYDWLHADVFDTAGHPAHVRGVTDVDGLYFLGLPWLHTWGSGRFAGLEEDSAHLADRLRTRARTDLATTH